MKKILIISDSFKGCLNSTRVEQSIATGIRSILTECITDCIPIADGGEGILETMLQLSFGKSIEITVHDPLMRPLSARYGLLNDNETAIIEMAQASGLPLLKSEERNPLQTTSYGTGELIKEALQKGYKKFIIGIGGSATNDAGMGMMQALGARFLDQEGNELPTGCGQLLKEVEKIDLTAFHNLIQGASFTIACDVNNPFYGLNGAACIFAPQKGAGPKEVKLLDEGLYLLSKQIQEATQMDISKLPGSGAAGGIGGTFAAFFNAKLVPGIDLVLEAAHFSKHLQGADLVITGEGKSDAQTLMGKVPTGVLRQAQKAGIPVVLLSGAVSDVGELNKAGFTAVLSIAPGPISLADAMKPETASKNLQDTAAQIARLTDIFVKKKGL